MDIVRCHSYHPLVHSRFGQQQLFSLLQAWLLANPSLRYWQGLDSVAAPLLALFAPSARPELAFGCLQRITDVYLRSFLLPLPAATPMMMLQGHIDLYCQVRLLCASLLPFLSFSSNVIDQHRTDACPFAVNDAAVLLLVPDAWCTHSQLLSYFDPEQAAPQQPHDGHRHKQRETWNHVLLLLMLLLCIIG